ncbi:MAG: tetratricopeptide repeat protein, partial [Gammaproteobacteria bacterium]
AEAAPTGHIFAMAATAIGWLGACWAWWSLRIAGGATASLEASGADVLLWNPLRAAAWYLQKLVVPWPQTNFAVWEMVPSAGVSAALLAIAAGGVLAGWLAWRRGRGGALLAGLCWTGLAIAPSLATTLSGVAETPVAERYLYLPSAGFAIAVGALLAGALPGLRTAAARRALAVAFAVLCTGLLALCLQRGLVWQNDGRLWRDATAKAPGYALPWIELGKAQAAQGEADESLGSFERARGAKGSAPTLAVASYNTGLIHAQRNESFPAERAFRDAVTLDPGYARGYYGLGRIALARAMEPGPRPPEDRRSLLDQAAADLKRAIDASPGFADAWLQLARVLEARGDTNAALLAVGSAERIDPRILSRPEVIALRRSLEMRAAGGG